MRPCFKVDPNAKMCSRAAGKFPVVRNSPRSEINCVVSIDLSTNRKGDSAHYITTPASGPSGGKVRQTSSERRHSLGRIDTGTLDETVLLNSREREIVSERVARRDELGTLLNDGPSSCLVGGVDDQGKVFWSHERWAGGPDNVESGL